MLRTSSRLGRGECILVAVPAEFDERDSVKRSIQRHFLARFSHVRATAPYVVDFCAQRGLSTASLCTWRKRLREEGDTGLAARSNARYEPLSGLIVAVSRRMFLRMKEARKDSVKVI